MSVPEHLSNERAPFYTEGPPLKVFDGWGDPAVDVREEFFPDLTDEQLVEVVKTANRELQHKRWYLL